jgi:inorganic pyrophosphatase
MLSLYEESTISVYIEIEKYSNIKYEWNKTTNTLDVDRILPPPYVYPFSYGFFPNTLGNDGDELDILVLTNIEYKPDTTIEEVEIIGGLYMEDEKGEDEKLFVIPKGDLYFTQLTEKERYYTLELIQWFFSNYKKNTPNKWSKTRGLMDTETAIQYYRDSVVRHHLSTIKPRPSVSPYNLQNTSSPPVICLLTKHLTEEWAHFLSSEMNGYEVYVVVDDNSIDYSERIKDTHINVIQIDAQDCYKTNYYKSSSWTNLKDVIAWDKALYYFNRINTQYENIWFIEDDVFIPSQEILQKIDRTHPTADLLTSFHEINETGNVRFGWNHWVNVIHRIGTPWAHSLICICRMSRRLMMQIDDYVKDRHLMIIESLFNTLAMHRGYIIEHPVELSEKSIHFNKTWNLEDIHLSNIYHPIKDVSMHPILRKRNQFQK